ncbi:RidA family protein [Actomonas aquatica]|uniref:RidA family protein n=1 Tax=Actomonas aquatica TaxID=2866162 RepID=A0ABZ1CH33_9BACT|nr:RidA family protein [Opitutus sp. WL0086]WRQ89580.1 RidA family protein [Opitutus sp. WL0086]
MKLRMWMGMLSGMLALAGSLRADTPEEKLAALGHELPAVAAPVANYVSVVRTGNLVYLAGHIPRDAAGKPIVGTVPSTMDLATARAAAERTALALLASLKSEIGELSKVKRIVRVEGFVASDDTFTDQPKVINGCSDLLVAVLGDAGRHTRMAIGTNTLPLGVVVEIAMIAEVTD